MRLKSMFFLLPHILPQSGTNLQELRTQACALTKNSVSGPKREVGRKRELIRGGRERMRENHRTRGSERKKEGWIERQ
jgi:hypothetical protein